MFMVSETLENLQSTAPDQRDYMDYVAAANELAALGPERTGLPTLKVAVLRNVTIETLLPVLASEIFLAGFHPQFYLGDFDAIQADVMDAKSALYSFGPDFIILFQWLEAISPALTTKFISTDPSEIESERERVRRHVREIILALNENVRVPILLNNFPLPSDPTLGILDSQSTAHHTHTILHLNADILNDVTGLSDVYIVDLMRLFALHGSLNCIDQRYWFVARSPFSQKALLALGIEYGKFFRALRGKAKKCLVLDCDNTLWGGIIGEDGPAEIKLGTTYPGSCFLALQQEILNLHARGVILAICSKNNEADVLQVLREHPDMLLREQHFSAWQINWDDKVTNLRRIAQDLNIGLESIVFVEDSEFEANFVREQLPEVSVLHLPLKAYGSYSSLLNRGGFFDALTFTAEDKRKSTMYQEQRLRAVLEADSTSLTDYLTRLEIEIEVGSPSEFDIPRVSQLTQKTNQFNLATRRYSEGEIRALLASDAADVFYLRLRDKISDQGLVGVAILTYEGLSAVIDDFLMSCRAIGRGAEHAFLSVILNHAIENRRCNSIVGVYIPTAKNGLVKEFYSQHAFSTLGQGSDAPTRRYAIDAASSNVKVPSWIRVRNGEPAYGRR